MRRSYLITVFLLTGLAAIVSFAEKRPLLPPILVITDLRMMGDEASVAEAQAFSEFVRKEIERTGLYRILSRSSMRAILKANSFTLQAHELSDFARMGRLLGADQVMAGYLKRNGKSLEITLRVIDVRRARFINTARRVAVDRPVSSFLGDWGREFICETFEIDPRHLQSDAPTAPVSIPSLKPTPIPRAIQTKYPGMIFIPAGNTLVGSNNGDPCERPAHQVRIEAFYIGQFEVTCEEYAEFIHTTSHAPPPDWNGSDVPSGLDKHPVSRVSFEDAEAYCLWRGGRLPSEAEWERAARGSGRRIYPWGNQFDSNRANTWDSGRKGTAPVGSYPQGKSGFGVEDISGNVFEWVADFFAPYPGAKIKVKDYDKHYRVLRGGSWNFNDYYARSTHRLARSGGEKGRSFGFRFARDP